MGSIADFIIQRRCRLNLKPFKVVYRLNEFGLAGYEAIEYGKDADDALTEFRRKNPRWEVTSIEDLEN